MRRRGLAATVAAMTATTTAMEATVETAAMEAATVEATAVGAATPSAAMKLGRGRFTRGDKRSHKGQCGQARYRRPGNGVSHR